MTVVLNLEITQVFPTPGRGARAVLDVSNIAEERGRDAYNLIRDAAIGETPVHVMSSSVAAGTLGMADGGVVVNLKDLDTARLARAGLYKWVQFRMDGGLMDRRIVSKSILRVGVFDIPSDLEGLAYDSKLAVVRHESLRKLSSLARAGDPDAIVKLMQAVGVDAAYAAITG